MARRGQSNRVNALRPSPSQQGSAYGQSPGGIDYIVHQQHRANRDGLSNCEHSIEIATSVLTVLLLLLRRLGIVQNTGQVRHETVEKILQLHPFQLALLGQASNSIPVKISPAHRRENPTSLVTDDRRKIFHRQQLQHLELVVHEPLLEMLPVRIG